MENSEDIIKKAIDLTYPFYLNEKVDDVYYVTQDGWAENDGNYCSGCIDEAVKEHRKYYLLDQRKKPINPDKEEIRRRFRLWRDNDFPKFDYLYESDREDNNFIFCDTCGQRLNVCFDLDYQEIDHWKTAEIQKNDSYGYELCTILSCYENECYRFYKSKNPDIKTERKEKLKKIELYLEMVDLAKRVIEVFEEKEV